jgi:predicted RNA methylase
MTSNIVLCKNIDFSAFAFSNVIKNKQGGSMVYLNYSDKPKFIIQTPIMNVPFGLSEFTPDNGPVKYSLDCSFNGHENDTKIKQFYDNVKKIDNMMIEKAVENSASWFGKTMSREVVEVRTYHQVQDPFSWRTTLD